MPLLPPSPRSFRVNLTLFNLFLIVVVGYIPKSVFWDSHEPKLFACEVHKIPAIQTTGENTFFKKTEDVQEVSGLMLCMLLVTKIGLCSGRIDCSCSKNTCYAYSGGGTAIAYANIILLLNLLFNAIVISPCLH